MSEKNGSFLQFIFQTKYSRFVCHLAFPYVSNSPHSAEDMVKIKRYLVFMLGHQKILAIHYAEQLSLGKPSNLYLCKIFNDEFCFLCPLLFILE